MFFLIVFFILTVLFTVSNVNFFLLIIYSLIISIATLYIFSQNFSEKITCDNNYIIKKI